MKQYYVYIMASKPRGTLYIGMTSDLIRRVDEHKRGLVDGFTKEYGLKILVYYEVYDSVEQAIKREKQLKVWKRVWKIELIENCNQDWRDLYFDLHFG
jgi:putative endonuclease